ncbi:MAG: AAA family ATPase [Cyanobacteria bacterium HKST-UBA06]|nr:AAA family ATPase [Cyanobacteria bacterium HKST-UBA04]MCA9808320.1 AAA family ATPase [Cyanobacteria bacterium HKST-UBA06]
MPAQPLDALHSATPSAVPASAVHAASPTPSQREQRQFAHQLRQQVMFGSSPNTPPTTPPNTPKFGFLGFGPHDPSQPPQPHHGGGFFSRLVTLATSVIFLLSMVFPFLQQLRADRQNQANQAGAEMGGTEAMDPSQQGGFDPRNLFGGRPPGTEDDKLAQMSDISHFIERAPGVTLDDVAGMPEVVKEIRHDVVNMFRTRHTSYVGEGTMQGVLLTGPPGTGKTHLARAIAGELKIPFFNIPSSNIVEMYVGLGAKRIREIFAAARKMPQGAVLFFDEFDAFGTRRKRDSGGSSEEANTLNALLTELNKHAENKNLVIIGASNMGKDLDEAAVRAGRFDRKYSINPPSSYEDLADIFAVHKRKYKVDPHFDRARFITMAKEYLPSGTTGADIELMMKEAGMLYRRDISQGKKREPHLSEEDIRQALIRVNYGIPKQHIKMTDHELDSVSRHEGLGHALVGYVLGRKPNFITVVPRSIGDGATAVGMVSWAAEDSFSWNTDRRDIEARMASLIAAQLSEEVAYGKAGVSAGASSDLEKLNELAIKAVSLLNLYGDSTQGVIQANHMSDASRREFEEQRKALLGEISQKARAFLKAIPKGCEERILSAIKTSGSIEGASRVRHMFNDPDTLAILKQETGCESWQALWKKATAPLSKVTTI